MIEKTICYSLPGEGLGHATRTYSILGKLDSSIKVHIFTWGEAYDFFKEQNYPYLYKIEAELPFGRNESGTISIPKTIYNFFNFIKKYKKSYNDIKNIIVDLNPDLIISDFEPILPRIAKKLNIKYLSIDNQHKFSRCYTEDLGLKLKFYSWLMGLYTELLVPNPNGILISTFYHSKIKKKSKSTFLANCFIRSSLESLEIKDNNFILVYYKKSSGDQILEQLNKMSSKYKIKVYGCPKEKRIYSNIEYNDISNYHFLNDLANCSYLFCSSGNQLIGEAIYCGKPIFTIPEHNQAEQYINAFFIKKMNAGTFCYLKDLNFELIQDFLNEFKTKNSSKINGADQAVALINNYLLEN